MTPAIKSPRWIPTGARRTRALDQSLFFIVGAPRSGTTLLRTMLSAHSRICIPPETEFFLHMTRAADRGRLRDEFLRYSRSPAFLDQSADAAGLLRSIDSGRILTRRGLFLEILRGHAERSSKNRVGEKTPHHCRRVPEIAAAFPQARFIHIYRDVRDVVASRVGMTWSTPSALANARSWCDVLTDHQKLKSRMPPDRYTEVRFESLLASPEAELRQLCDFLDEPFEPAMLHFHEQPERDARDLEPSLRHGTFHPLDQSAAGRHRARLNQRQLASVQRVAGPIMDALGYARSPVQDHFWWRMLDAAEVVGERAARLPRSIRKRLTEIGAALSGSQATGQAGIGTAESGVSTGPQVTNASAH